jgi:microsomal dipeptidase-like Zn-dependent dipeptidase
MTQEQESKRRPRWRRLGMAFGVFLVAFFVLTPGLVERGMNRVHPSDLPAQGLGPVASALHGRAFVADLHADTSLWDRDLLARSSRGHVDLVRLREGGVALQAFTIVTQFPRPERDLIGLLAFAELRPPPAWLSPYGRAVDQIRALHDAARRSEGSFRIIKTREDLEAFERDRSTRPDLVGGFIGVEGAHAIEGDLGKLEALIDAGVRMMAPTHFFDNDIGGAGTEPSNAGLTSLGRAWVRKMEERNAIIDLAHASERTIADVTALARRPLVVSHTGVRTTCDNPRNLSEGSIRRIAATGGVIGIAFFEAATCGADLQSIVRAIRSVIYVAGIDHVALGSDFDGAVSVPFDATGLPRITEALLNIGLTEPEIRKVLGGNVLRVLLGALP